jgi:hypothetical protein
MCQIPRQFVIKICRTNVMYLINTVQKWLDVFRVEWLEIIKSLKCEVMRILNGRQSFFLQKVRSKQRTNNVKFGLLAKWK